MRNQLLPISTAPRDGTFVLLACPSGYSSAPLRFTEGQWSADRGDWVDHANDRINNAGEPPKYWMPIPTEPPAPTAADWLVGTTVVPDSPFGATLRLPDGCILRLLELRKGSTALHWAEPTDNATLCSALAVAVNDHRTTDAFKQTAREARDAWIESEREAGNLPTNGEDFVTPFDQFLY